MTNRINARELFKLKLKYIASSLRGLLIFPGGLLFVGLLTGGLLSGPLARISRSRHFKSQISEKWRVLGTKLLQLTNRKLYLTY